MAHYYFDTSALAKIYHHEAGASAVNQILDDPSAQCWIARLTSTEMISVFSKKVRTGQIRQRDFERLKQRFYSDILSRRFALIRVLNGHFDGAAALIVKYGKTRQLVTLDALQLAVALSITNPGPTDHFVSADQRLLEIVALEGLSGLNPEVI